jgi:poly(A)-specific ribonuclease
MEILKENYLEYEQQIIQDINNCNFLSLDLELTGIANKMRNFLDSPTERYFKIKISAEKFKIIQLGIVPWFKNENNKIVEYRAKPYNIYLFPDEEVGNQQINCELSSIVFNRENGMDFNKWIRNGVNYINEKQFKRISENLIENNINNYNPDDTKKFKKVNLYKEDDKILAENLKKKITEFLLSDNNELKIENEKKIPKYILIYILNDLQPIERNLIYIIEKDNQIIIQKTNENDKKNLIEKDNIEIMKNINKKKGVKNIFDAITNNKKIIIGHNCSLDIIYLISHFGDSLPNDYKEFKNLIQKYFDSIYDTKFIYEINFGQNSDSSLNVVYNYLKEKNNNNKLNIIIDNNGFTNYLDENESKKNHQADYDAFITGSSFIYMLEILGEKNMEQFKFKIKFMKTFYKCFDFLNEEDYEAKDTIPFFLKAKISGYDFSLKNLVSDENYLNLIKKFYYYDNNNTYIIMVDNKNSLHEKLINELKTNGEKFFMLLNVKEYKDFIIEEEKKRKKNNFNYIKK